MNLVQTITLSVLLLLKNASLTAGLQEDHARSVGSTASCSHGARADGTKDEQCSQEGRSVELTEHDCPQDILLLQTEGSTPFSTVPIVVLEQSEEFVRFGVRNTFPSTIQVFTQFHEKPTGTTECYRRDDLEEKALIEFTAYCMQTMPLTVVDIWVAADTLDPALDIAEVPLRCQPPRVSTPTVQYTFKIMCVSKCSAEEETNTEEMHAPTLDDLSPPRVDRGRSVGYSDGELQVQTSFCATVDYPCGDSAKLVNVCHYSAKDGYQTFCVPESDSNVLEYYPKDYCGPCVGRFR